MSLAEASKHVHHAKMTDHIMQTLATYFKNLGVPAIKGFTGVQKEIDEGLKLIPYESSVMGIKDLGDNVAQVHFFTVGTPKDLDDDIKFFYNNIKSSGFTTIYDTAPSPITTAGLQKLGAKIVQSDNPKYKFKAMV